MNKKIALLALTTLMLAACGSDPKRVVETRTAPAPIDDRTEAPTKPRVETGGGYLAGDGPGTDIPANIDEIPNAEPRSEPLHRFANRPYTALGKTYTPMNVPGKFKQRGIASWYGKKFHGQRTSSGESYNMYAMTAAHPTLPIPSYARVTNVANQKSVIVRVNDRGPFLHQRIMDLSYTAAHKLNIIGTGSAEVELESLSSNPASPSLAKPQRASYEVASAPAERVSSTPLPPADTPAKAPLLAEEKSPSGNIYLQLGAFKSQDTAESFMTKMSEELADNGKKLGLYRKEGLVRVHIGPYLTQNEARDNAEMLKAKLGFKPVINLH